jgi:hypothetical protein
VSALAHVKALLAAAEGDWPALLARLEGARAALMRRDNLIINVTGECGHCGQTYTLCCCCC